MSRLFVLTFLQICIIILSFRRMSYGEDNSMKAPWNLEWHDDLLATGGMIKDLETFDWLIENGFSCVVSLDDFPDFIKKKMSEAHLSQAFHFVSGVSDPPIEELSDFIASHIVEGRKVYIHCNAGANRSPKLARAFMAKREFYIVSFLRKRAEDLNHGDEQDFWRGHMTYNGENTLKAIALLDKGLASEEDKILFYSADALIELIDHTDHGCFDHNSKEAMKVLCSRVLEVLLRENPGGTDAYIRILNRFDPPKY